jgi:NAD(P)H-hydrate repair Nnr-like enzyme with NAD(P)H-hydrate dehydratase domain
MFSAFVAARTLAQGADAVALAAQREAEENLKRMTASIEVVQTAQEAQQKQIAALAGEVEKLRTEVARTGAGSASQESIKRLSEQIIEVDKSRIADNKRIQDALEKLAKLIAERPPVVTPRPRETPPPVGNGGGTAHPVNDEGFEYVIQKGDLLDKIVQAYREQKIMVTKKSIIDANPTVNWSKLQIGQKIFIPKPK